MIKKQMMNDECRTMKKGIFSISSFIIHILALSFFIIHHSSFIIPAHADFDDLGVGARPMGMGNAFVGLANDVRTISYNPAGLAYIRRNEFGADYSRLFPGLDDNSNLSAGFVAVAIPLSRRKALEDRIRELKKVTVIETITASTETTAVPTKTEEAKTGELTFFKELGTFGIGFNNMSLSGVVSENTVWLSYGRKMRENLTGGFSLKFFYENYTQDLYTKKDPVFDYGGKSSLLKYSMDVGALYNIIPKFFWGISLSDVNRPNVALSSNDRELLPVTLKNGFAYYDKQLSAAVDLIYKEGFYKVYAGAEKWFKNRTYALRTGGGIGSREYKNFTFGMSAKFGNVQMDYAFLYPVSGVKETYGNHRISFVYRFGKAPLDELETGSLELYYAKLQAEAEMLRARLEKAEDERSRMEKVLVEEALSRLKEKVRAEKLEATVTKKTEGIVPSKILPAMSAASGGMRTYVTSKGDSLQSIAELFYNKRDRWIEIFNLNKDKIGRGGSLKPGTVLLIPGAGGVSIEEPTAASREPAILAPIGQTLAPIGTGTQQEKVIAPLPVGKTLAPIKIDKEFNKKESFKGAEPQKPKTYTVMQGDTLASIAQKVYGDSKRWKDIYNANKNKTRRGNVAPGEVLVIP